MKLHRLRPLIEKEISHIINTGKPELSPFRVFINGIVATISVVINHHPFEDMLDVTIFIENWQTDINSESVTIDATLLTSVSEARQNYPVDCVSIMNVNELKSYTDEDLANRLKTDWNDNV